ncbi:hypothetical protein GCM10022252_30950 [Streptosporangium oxazolinicum]|uniref:Uncharacterized protein n=1 Tax=Streptosporangium oxazolinicum TaxID=909287 RepID=A0ABP8AV59_9ACTN
MTATRLVRPFPGLTSPVLGTFEVNHRAGARQSTCFHEAPGKPQQILRGAQTVATGVAQTIGALTMWAVIIGALTM